MTTHARSLLVLACLAAGLAGGALIQAGFGGRPLAQAAPVIEAVGGLWLNALRMTVGPLVFSLLVSAVAGVADAMATGRVATRAVMTFAALLLLAGVVSVSGSLGLLALWPVDHTAAEAFVAGAARGGAEPVAVGSVTE